MADASILTNAVRHYAWGSHVVLPQLLGEPVPSAEPWAEIWIGAHPSDASVLPDGQSLADVEPDLPFLVKLLAADAPLSLQAHPDLAQARAGFAREEAAGIARGAAGRTYKDLNHKPELLVALMPTDALCGFREPAEVLALAERVGAPRLVDLVADLATGGTLRETFVRLLTLDGSELGQLLAEVDDALATHTGDHPSGDLGPADHVSAAWVLRLIDLHPGDAGAVAPLLLRLVQLAPGDGLFVGPGVLHAYLHGAGVEVQASSDNVLRGGLTPKTVDIPDLLRVMTDVAGPAPLVRPRVVGACVETYDVPVRDFAVWRVRPAGAPVVVEAPGSRVVVCIEGEVAVCGCVLRPGAAAYVPGEVPAVIVEGAGTAFVTARG